MCQSYRKPCACGQRNSEIMFGNMILDEAVVAGVYCPQCSATVDVDPATMVVDNGWILELDSDILRAYASRMGMEAASVTAEEAFDGGFATWVGMGPEDNVSRSTEREEISRRTAGDPRAQFEAFKKWAVEREARLAKEGWRKARRAAPAAKSAA